MGQVIRKPVLPIYCAAAVWAVWGIFFPFYRLPHFVLAALLSLLVYAAVGLFCHDTVVAVPDVKEKPKEKPKAETPEMAAFTKQAAEAADDMKRLRGIITEPWMRSQLMRVEEVFAKLADHVRDNPQKLPRVRKFMSYYLPTTIKQFETYAEMDETGVEGENITATKSKIRGVMATIVPAFEKQLDSLYGDVALDISTDITVLEGMLEREGLTGSQMKG